MKLPWKDFFHFQQNDKRAILLLLILIVLCIGVTIYSDNLLSESGIVHQKEMLDEFENFQRSLTSEEDVQPAPSRDAGQKISHSKTASPKKLKEGETIDLNIADIATIKRIPGIGDGFGKRIYDYRNQLGGFASQEQLMEIQGITQKRYEKIAPYIGLKKTHKKIKINTLSPEILSKHPYIDARQAQAIVVLREKKKLEKMEDLLSSADFSSRDIDRLSAYLSFD